MMTAMLAARLVDAGKLKWNTPISTLASLDQAPVAGWESVTLDYLLCHRAGLAANLDWHSVTSPAEAVARVLADPPSEVGTYAYSNTGYVLAGALIARAAGQSWEDLIHKQVWQPLGISRAGFGGMGMAG